MLLKVGSTGEDVKKLQTKLGLTADGAFGPNTEKKVKEWHKFILIYPSTIISSLTHYLPLFL